MNWDQIEGNWKQVKGKAKEQWGKLTDDDFDCMASLTMLVLYQIRQAPPSL